MLITFVLSCLPKDIAANVLTHYLPLVHSDRYQQQMELNLFPGVNLTGECYP